MSYLVLARKFRPQTFASIEGQEHVTLALKNAILRNRLGHAFLFSGPRGVGKTSAARVLARALNCTGRKLPDEGGDAKRADSYPSVEPCGKCTNCIEIARSSSLAVWEIDGASHNGVENVRSLIEVLNAVPPPGSRYKIYIIDEVHMLSVAAFNALLKSLEEPPPNTVFVFATTEIHKIPDTVVSRCQRFDFKRLSVDVIAGNLREIARVEGFELDDDVFYFLARKAQGGMRDAQMMLDRVASYAPEEIDPKSVHELFGFVDPAFFFELSKAVLDKDVSACFELVERVFSQSVDVRSFLGDLLTHWRNLLLLGFYLDRGGENLPSAKKMLLWTDSELEAGVKQLTGQSVLDLERIFDVAERTVRNALTGKFPRYSLEAGLAKMASLSSLKPMSEILGEMRSLLAANGGSQPRIERAASKVDAPGSAPQKKKRVEPRLPPKGIPNGLEAESEEMGPNFTPSWDFFVQHVKSRSEHVLAAFLRRVVPLRFDEGVLELEAEKFDLSSLSDPKTSELLRDCLYSYSGVDEWKVSIKEHKGEGAISESPSFRKGSGRVHGEKGVPNSKRNGKLIEGSVGAKEERLSLERRKELEEEMREHPAVKTVLDVFEGSEVERLVTGGSRERAG